MGIRKSWYNRKEKNERWYIKGICKFHEYSQSVYINSRPAPSHAIIMHRLITVSFYVQILFLTVKFVGFVHFL